jgi:hypothetical protein
MNFKNSIKKLWDSIFSCENNFHDFTNPEMPFVLGYGWVIDWEIRKCKKCGLKQKRKISHFEWIDDWKTPYRIRK